MTSSESLGKRVKFLRKQLRLSQLELSIDSGVNKNYICDLEKGRRNPTLDVLERIADALGVSLEGLFKGVESIPGL
jgi:transcriptional regulator with XRE-family HTH domain